MMGETEGIQVLALDQGPALSIVEGKGRAHAVIWPGMGAQLRSIHRIELGPAARTAAMRHPSEAVYSVLAGTGDAVDLDAPETQALGPGSMVHIDAGTAYVLSAGEEGLLLVGGPSPPDPALYAGLE